MFRWRRRLLFAPLILAVAIGAAPAATAATAAPADNVVTVTGGSATTTTASGVVGKLALAGIVPLVLKPGIDEHRRVADQPDGDHDIPAHQRQRRLHHVQRSGPGRRQLALHQPVRLQFGQADRACR